MQYKELDPQLYIQYKELTYDFISAAPSVL